MSAPPAAGALVAHLVLLSLISFGGVPAVLPDLRDYVVAGNGWLTDRDFTDCFAVVQAIPGPNMILMMSFIGWKLGGLPLALASALAIFVPSCTVAFAVFHWWERFRETAWQQRARQGLAPVTIGLVIAGGYVMGFGGDAGWTGAAVTIAAAALMLRTRLNPMWLVAGGGALGACGLL